ncbi:MAG: helix-turn-helix transcriptional regulator [Polyangiaceae bacterium]
MLDRLERSIGFDAGYIAASWGSTDEGRGAVADYDPLFLKKNIGRFLAEILPTEVAHYTERARLHHEVWSSRRQEQLAVFRELLLPARTKHMIVRVGVRNGNVAGFNLERRGMTQFTERDLQLTNMVAPFLHIAEMLTLRERDDCVSPAFACDYRLTKRECEFVALTSRGLQNTEIALLMNISRNTVRNTLARVFEKVGVSNRAELAYLATRPCEDLPQPQPMKVRGKEGRREFTALVRQAAAEKAKETSGITAAGDRGTANNLRMRYAPPLPPGAG